MSNSVSVQDLCRICEDLAANLLILHICAGDVQEVYEIFIYIKQILSLEFESLRARQLIKGPMAPKAQEFAAGS